MGSKKKHTAKRAGVTVARAAAPSRVQTSPKTTAKAVLDASPEASERALPIRSSPFSVAPSRHPKVAIVVPAATVPTARPRAEDAARESSNAASDRTPAAPRAPAAPRTPAVPHRAAKARTPAKAKAPPFARRVVIQELEPRLLLSADLNPAAQDTLFATPAMQGAEYRALVEPGSQPVVTSMEVAPIQRTNELVFVDTATHNYQQLVDDMRENALAKGRDLQFVLIDPQQDGIRKITDTLAQNANLDAIHIISHAVDGAVQIGSAQLDLQTLAQRSTAIRTWGNALNEDGDLLIYGCDLAATSEGQRLVDTIADLTGADVAASEDPTGAASKGGNWKLEFTTGKIQTPVAVSEAGQAAWDALLAPPVVNLNGSSGTVTVASDTFDTSTYTGGTGWSAGWTEFDASPTRFIAGTSNSDNTPASGNVVYGTSAGAGTDLSMAFVGHGNQFNDSIQRQANLLSYTTATLTFTYKLQNIESPDAVAVQVSKDGGATFTTLATYTANTGGSYVASGNLDISSYISDKTVVRFAVTGGFGETDDRFFVDNVTITASGRNYNATFTEGGAAVAIAAAGATVTDSDAGQQMQGATVTLNNPQTGDVLALSGALPSGITGSVSGNVLTLSGLSSTANYAAALKLVTFSNTSAAPNTTTRNISVQITDAASEQSAVVDLVRPGGVGRQRRGRPAGHVQRSECRHDHRQRDGEQRLGRGLGC